MAAAEEGSGLPAVEPKKGAVKIAAAAIVVAAVAAAALFWIRSAAVHCQTDDAGLAGNLAG